MSTADVYVTAGGVLVRFSYHAMANGRMRNQLGGHWSTPGRCWSLPANTLDAVTEVLQGLGFEVVVHRSEVEPTP